MEHPLVIVIPAFKPDFLKKALSSIENQHDLRFHVIIGDDGSPHSLESICAPFVETHGWTYHRFEDNLGKTDLVGHWNRCVALTNKPWIWLFSDDDEMDPDCVAGFYESLKENPQAQVLKFNFSIIDKDSNLLENNELEKEDLSGFEFGKLRFERKVLTSAVEFIFSRKAWEREGGFINFPAAWCSDDASWISFTEPEKIRLIRKGLVFWRLSEVNISSLAGDYVYAKLEAALLFINWFNERFKNKISPTLFGEQVIWLRLQLEHIQYQVSMLEALSLTFRLKPKGILSWLRTWNEMYAVSQGSMQKKKGLPPSRFRDWISKLLPRF